MLQSGTLENFVNKIFEVLATDERSFEMNFQNLSKGSGIQLAALEKEQRIWPSNLAKNKGTLNNYNSLLGVKGIDNLPKSTSYDKKS